jgi:hypothetical protein
VRASRRDGELARQILLAIRYILPSKNPRRKRPRLAGREFFDEALRLCEIVSDAESLDPALLGQPLTGDGALVVDDAATADDESAPELEPVDNYDRSSRRRRGRGGRSPGRGEGREEPRGSIGDGAVASTGAGASASERRDGERPLGPAPAGFRPAPRPALATAVRTATTLDGLLGATALLLKPSRKAPFLGTGAFGGPWSVSHD